MNSQELTKTNSVVETAEEVIDGDSVIELVARQSNDGLKVLLLWDSIKDVVVVAVHDEKSEDFELNVPREKAMDAFNHPFAYRYSGELALMGAQAA